MDALIFVHNTNYTDANIYLWTGNSNYFMSEIDNPDSKVRAANTGPTWVLSAPDGPQVGPMNLAIWEVLLCQNDHNRSPMPYFQVTEWMDTYILQSYVGVLTHQCRKLRLGMILFADWSLRDV